MRARRVLLAMPIAAALGVALAAHGADTSAPAARPQIYKWVDENGIAHYTTDPQRLPDALRRRAEQLGGEAPALERESLAPRAPGDRFDAWVNRNRAAPEADAWDEGVFPGSDEASPSAASPEERAERRQEQQQIDQRIAELEAEVAADEDVLKDRISDPSVRPLDRGEDEELRQVAARLPARLDELRTLRERRNELESP